MVNALVPNFTPISVKLNDEYSAEIQADRTVKVGCQIIPADAIFELADKLKTIKS